MAANQAQSAVEALKKAATMLEKMVPAGMSKRFQKRADIIKKYYDAKMPIVKKYAYAELKPPTRQELPQISREISKIVNAGTSGAWKELTTYQVFLNMVVVWEIFCWFCVGEIIGKGCLRGYKVGYGSEKRGTDLMTPKIYPDGFANERPLPKNKA